MYNLQQTVVFAVDAGDALNASPPFVNKPALPQNDPCTGASSVFFT